jgi:hypothetical protein
MIAHTTMPYTLAAHRARRQDALLRRVAGVAAGAFAGVLALAVRAAARRLGRGARSRDAAR